MGHGFPSIRVIEGVTPSWADRLIIYMHRKRSLVELLFLALMGQRDTGAQGGFKGSV